MIKYLKVNNIVILKDVTIDFKYGLTSIMGQTGSGKSLIIKSLSALIKKTTKLNNIDNQASIEALFHVDNNDYHVRKEFEESVTCYLNHKKVSQKKLSDFLESHIYIHSQFDTNRLLEPDNYLEIIDKVNEINYVNYHSKLEIYSKELAIYQKLLKRKDNIEDEKLKLENIIKELSEIDFSLDYEKSKLELAELTNFEKINANLYEINSESKRIIDSIKTMQLLNEDLSKYGYTESAKQIKDIYYDFEDYKDTIYSCISKLTFSSDKLNHLNNYIFDIEKYCKKYNKEYNELLQLKEQSVLELENINDIDTLILNQDKKLNDAYNECIVEANRITSIRKENSLIIVNTIKEYFTKLDLTCDLRIDVEEIKIDKYKNKFNKNGINKAIILIQTNIDQDFIPLTSVSGGELSRIMLAIILVYKKYLNLKTLILDEIDTGISSKVASNLGKLLKISAENKQIIIISHIPQVIYQSNNIIKIQKVVNNNITNVISCELTEQEKNQELKNLTNLEY